MLISIDSPSMPAVCESTNLSVLVGRYASSLAATCSRVCSTRCYPRQRGRLREGGCPTHEQRKEVTASVALTSESSGVQRIACDGISAATRVAAHASPGHAHSNPCLVPNLISIQHRVLLGCPTRPLLTRLLKILAHPLLRALYCAAARSLFILALNPPPSL